MPAAVFKGEHSFGPSANGPDGMELSTRLTFSGMMAPPITKTIPDMGAHLERFLGAPNKRAESADETMRDRATPHLENRNNER